MYDTDTKSQFIELRAKGWSLPRISDRLQVAHRTLVEWNRQHKAELQVLRAHEKEAIEERILASREQELTRLKQDLDRVDEELVKRSLESVSTEKLHRMAASLRAEIRSLRVDPDRVQQKETGKGEN
jgi:hypothetical protein